MVRIISALVLPLFLAFFNTAAMADTVKLADNAPDSYTVVKGDTLWDISGRFLKQPWRWPEVWRMNREQIRNPHWIYPGQIIYLDRSGPYLSLEKPGSGTSGDGKLEPKVYSQDISPIGSVPMNLIAPFLTRPLVVGEKEQAGQPTIIATEEGRLYTGAGDTVFAKNVDPAVEDWQVYRRAEPIVDLETQKVLGYEAAYLGTAHVTTKGNPSTLQVTTAVSSIGQGDRLVPAVRPELMSLVPHAPQGKVEGRVVKVVDGLYSAGKYSVIAMSAGRSQNVEPGNVLALYRNRGKVVYDLEGKKEKYDLPEDRLGLVFVFRVFENISYGLIVESSSAVKLSDVVRQP